MDWKKLSPWNWLRKEQEPASELPVTRQSSTLPSYPLTSLHQEIDRLVEQALRGFGMMPGLPHWTPGTLFRPQLDIREAEKNYVIRVEVPGLKKDDIRITLDEDTLIIEGEKHEEKSREEDQYHYSECSYGSFRRVLSLPADAETEALKARFENGVLILSVPRKPAKASDQSRHITIE